MAARDGMARRRAGAPWLPMWAAIVLMLLAPLAGMQITGEIAWSQSDFAAAALLLGGAGAIFELVRRRVARKGVRRAAGAALLAAVLVIWAEGAVGIV